MGAFFHVLFIVAAEATERDSGLKLSRSSDANDELIELGDMARHSRLPLDNQ